MGIVGVLTYEDVTNIDSVGVITARSGIQIGVGEQLDLLVVVLLHILVMVHNYVLRVIKLKKAIVK